MGESPLALANQVDQVKAFMLYSFYGGDVEKAAAAARVDVRIIQALEHDFQWKLQIVGQNRLDTPEGLKAEQEANRAANYTMAQRFARILEKLVLDAEKDDTFAATMCIDVDEDGNKTFSPKPLVEIAKAIQITHDMSYRALGDKIATKAGTTPTESGDHIRNLTVNLYRGLEKMGNAVREVREGNKALEVETRASEVIGEVVVKPA